MGNTDKTTLGDRMKEYEAETTKRTATKGFPIIARLDGKNFHTYTKGLKRPYDEGLSMCMNETMKSLVDKFQANVGYTQSDEITLVWYHDVDDKSEYPFGGRFQKLESLLAAYCTLKFNKITHLYLPNHQGEPIFDCRAFTVPNLKEAYNCILWRQRDATKNAISMAAQSMFSHKSLQGQNGSQMKERMLAEKGVYFDDYPAFFKRGIFAKKVKVYKELEPSVIQKLIDKGVSIPTEKVERSELQNFDVDMDEKNDSFDLIFGNCNNDNL